MLRQGGPLRSLPPRTSGAGGYRRYGESGIRRRRRRQRRGWIPVLHRQAVASFQGGLVLQFAHEVVQRPVSAAPSGREPGSGPPPRRRSPPMPGQTGELFGDVQAIRRVRLQDDAGAAEDPQARPERVSGEGISRPSFGSNHRRVLFSDPGNPPFPALSPRTGPRPPRFRTRTRETPVFGGRSGQQNTTIPRKGVVFRPVSSCRILAGIPG